MRQLDWLLNAAHDKTLNFATFASLCLRVRLRDLCDLVVNLFVLRITIASLADVKGGEWGGVCFV
jgi:hypothetical protein